MNHASRLDARRIPLGTEYRPSVWLYNNEQSIGDFHNALAIAQALNPSRIYLFTNPRIGVPNDDGSISMSYYDYEEITRDPYALISPRVKRFYPGDFPDILLDSSGDEVSRAPRGIATPHCKHKFPVFDKTLTVQLSLPSLPISDTPLIDDAKHLNLAFSHQFAPDEALPNHTHLLDIVPSRVNSRTLTKSLGTWGNQFSAFTSQRPVHLVLIGERTEGEEPMLKQDIIKLSETVRDAIGQTGGSLIVATSPRTRSPSEVIKIFSGALEGSPINTYFYNYGRNPEHNPYMGVLGMADKIIVTDDSMSMASDAIATGKPVFLFHHNETSVGPAVSDVHRQYNALLHGRGYVQPIEQLAHPRPVSAGMNSADIAAAYIQARFAEQMASQPIAGDDWQSSLSKAGGKSSVVPGR